MQSNGLNCGMVISICLLYFILSYPYAALPCPHITGPLSPATTLLPCAYSITASFSLTPIPFFSQAYRLKKFFVLLKISQEKKDL